METEMLYDGPLDGLIIPTVPAPTYCPTPDVLKEFPTAAATVYRRRGGGRLYVEGSKWEANS